MRRRKLFTLAAGVSAVLCCAVCVLWVRSYSTGEWLEMYDPRGCQTLCVSRGMIVARWEAANPSREMTLIHASVTDPRPIEPPVRRETLLTDLYYRMYFDRLGSWLACYEEAPAAARSTELAVPLWLLGGISAIAPAARLARGRRLRSRANSGRCPTCGYDLRATPDRCPECGAIPAAGA
jgi:hypothetical protein